MSEESMAHKFLWGISSAALIGLYVGAWWFKYPSRQRDCFLCSSGQVETIEVDMVASKPGRIKQVHVHPGETITNGQVVAHMDTQHLEMQLHEAGIALLKARSAAEEAKNQLTLRNL